MNRDHHYLCLAFVFWALIAGLPLQSRADSVSQAGIAPRINGPSVLGVRPGHPLLHAIPATGTRPLRFSIDGLPEGVSLDPDTGFLRGMLARPGDYPILLRATNAYGSVARAFTIKCGEAIALTPAMGWNSWNCWGDRIDQDRVLRAARALVSSGLKEHGWTYVNIDDGWQGERSGSDKALQANERFPDMGRLSDEVHALGLKLGLYSTPWVRSYAGYAGGSSDGSDVMSSGPSPGDEGRRYGACDYILADAAQWAAWGVDYLKYDWAPMDLMHAGNAFAALRNSGRDIVLSLSNAADPGLAREWPKVANSWRTTGDIGDRWQYARADLESWRQGVSEIGFSQNAWASAAGPGHWNDPDMLVVGRLGWGDKQRQTLLTKDEQYSHFSLWCMLSAPLLLGCNLEELDEFTLSLLTNDEVLAIDQDALGRQAVCVATVGAVDVYAKPLEDGSRALAFFNRSSLEERIWFKNLKGIGLQGRWHVRDLWRHADLPDCEESIEANIGAHGVLLLRLSSAGSEDFALELTDGRVFRRQDMKPAVLSTEGVQGWVLETPALAVTLQAHAISPDYCRQVLGLENRGTEEVAVARLVLADFKAPEGARVAGECGGSPVVAGTQFWGVEHPFADNQVVAGRVRCALPILMPLRPGERVQASLVSGRAAEPSQLRRTFSNYLEKERPRATAPYLLHNTWYNLGYSSLYAEKEELALMDTLGRELVERRGVRIDSFVLDDGWDDTRTLWRFHAGWPLGLRNMRASAAKLSASPGIWLSPWGGYNVPKKERLAAAAPEGFEIRDGGFSLAGPRYYSRFRELCLRALQEGGVGFFKFDGIGTKSEGIIDPAAGRDFDAMLRLIDELRAARPGLYVSQTVGTWPSPWWLLHVDNIWRGGEDHGFAGEGSDRQRWITYRDSQVYSNIVRRAPLFPLSSLMLHGIILARHAERLSTAGDEDFKCEVRSFFGSGVQLQELYLSPELVSQAGWDAIAGSAKWARASADVLQDAHWIGGDPAKLEPYGWAAWRPRAGIVTLRNPSSRPMTLTFDPKAALELPAGVNSAFTMTSAYADSRSPMARLEADKPVQILLQPFEVLVLQLAPVVP